MPIFLFSKVKNHIYFYFSKVKNQLKICFSKVKNCIFAVDKNRKLWITCSKHTVAYWQILI